MGDRPYRPARSVHSRKVGTVKTRSTRSMSRNFKAIVGVVCIALSSGAHASAQESDEPAEEVHSSPMLPAAPRALSRTVAVSGQVIDPFGVPEVATIYVQAWPNPAHEDAEIALNGAVQLGTLSTVTTDALGNFAVELSLDAIPSEYITEDRQVDLQLMAQSAIGHGLTAASVAHISVDTLGQVWLDPVYRMALQDAVSAGDAKDIAEAARLAAKHVTLTTDQPGLASQFVRIQPPPGTVGPKFHATSGTPCKMIALADYQHGTKVSDTFPNGRTGASGTSHIYFGHSSGIGYGFKPNGGSWSTKGHQARSSETTIKPTYSSANRYYKKTHHHRYYREDCVKPDNTGWVTYGYYYRSLSATGGATAPTTSYKPSWTWCTQVPTGEWIRDKNRSYSHSGAVEAPIGAYFHAYSAYSSGHTIQYKVGSGTSLCGDNDWPSASRRVSVKP